ncbi:MAG: hypothetical protein ACREQF_09955 [Candidatus Binataceae bacterium]
MKHATDPALDTIEPLLAEIRKLPGLKERKRGSFYHGGSGFLHFHEDPAGMFADLKVDGTFVRYRVSATGERKTFVAAAKRAVNNAD